MRVRSRLRGLYSNSHLTHYWWMNLVLYSQRLILTPFDGSDVDFSIELFTNGEVRRYTGGPMSEDQIRAEITSWSRRGGNGCIGIWYVSHRDSGEKLGTVALLPMPVDEKHTDYDQVVPGRMPEADIEVGFFLKRSAWGKGYATEACRRIIRMAFEDSPLTQVVATFDPGNIASRKVLEKSGFVDRGTMRSYGEDGPSYRITRDEWLKSRDPRDTSPF